VWRFYPRHEREIALREEYAAEAAQPVST
jgi:hypothetical protein